MIGNLIESTYVYDNATPSLLSEVSFTGKVVIREDKVYKTEGNIKCKWKDKSFSFALRQPEVFEEEETSNIDGYKAPTYSTPNWPSGLSVDNTIREFVEFIEEDIKAK